MGPRLTYPQPLQEGIFLRRRKRFFADVRLPDGREVVAHCANTGSMKGLALSGCPARVSFLDDPKRKLKWTLQQLYVDNTWVMVHTALPNRLVEAAVLAGEVPELVGYAEVRRERRYGQRNSRIDLELSGRADTPVFVRGGEAGEPVCFVEIKNVTLVEGTKALFPDAVTERGRKHLEELLDMASDGHRSVLFLHVARGDVETFEPARDIDPAYAEAFDRARQGGVEMLAYTLDVREDGLSLARRITIP